VSHDPTSTPPAPGPLGRSVDGWIRTNRRAPGSPYEGPGQQFHPGPWHAIQGAADGSRIGGSPLSWCGKQPTRSTINLRRHPGSEPPVLTEGERLCPQCLTRIKANRPGAYRRR
jgi:hypothetical protein